METEKGPILFFDGVCNLCNRTVQFIIRHDKRSVFRFAPLQSKRGAELLLRIEQERGYRPDSVILLYGDKYYLRSSAALKAAALLGGWPLLLMPGYLLPVFIRDAIYNAVAGKRYQWFGRRDECMIPTPDLKARFLVD